MSNVKYKSALCAVALLGLGALASLSAYALSDKQRAAIEERIRPVGEVCLEGDSTCGQQMAAGSGGDEERSPESIYDQYCTACHASGVAGAPKLGDEAAWDERLDKGIEEVYANSVNGIGGMPPKGTCMNCSEEEIQNTVDYMIEASE